MKKTIIILILLLATTGYGGTKMIPDLLDIKYPFSFIYDSKHSSELLPKWQASQKTEQLDENRTKTVITWTDPVTKLKVTREIVQYSDYPAIDWVLYFENTGTDNTKLIENIQALDVTFEKPFSADTPFILHKTYGSPSTKQDFMYSTATININHSETMGGGRGFSSNQDFPFFKIQTFEGSYIIAVGWSGQWQSKLSTADNKTLHDTAGLEQTRFVLYPGEKVRSPRILILHWQSDTWEANAQFRQLIYKHYAAMRSGRKPVPQIFCNSCFCKGGAWLNDTTEQNQVSLINAYGKLGIDAFVIDAGWFNGGFPPGTGNWSHPREDNYPDGFEPVAAAAKKNNMSFGCWFFTEFSHKDTEQTTECPKEWFFKNPDWLLANKYDIQDHINYLLNYGKPEVQNYFFNIVKQYMDIDGFNVYRTDSHNRIRDYWRAEDDEHPDRVGIAEIKHITGLYDLWDRMAAEWPDQLREECASGGRRIDLETVMRMHIHQKTDFWFDNTTDQTAVWGLSQYLPNNCFVTHLARMDDYSFHSVLPASLCLGWFVDQPEFDTGRAKL
jgi:alpha-galactosidase